MGSGWLLLPSSLLCMLFTTASGGHGVYVFLSFAVSFMLLAVFAGHYVSP